MNLDHVILKVKPEGGHLIHCTRCLVDDWHCPTWVTSVELAARLEHHKKDHAECTASGPAKIISRR